MPAYTDLSSLKSERTIDFNFINDSTCLEDYKINIYNIDLEKLMLTNQFTLYFDDYLSIDIKNSIYKQLLDNQMKKGYKNVYKSFDLKYRKFINENYNHFSERLFYFINRIWWNFGYNKQRVFVWAIIFILIFSIPIRIWFKFFADRVYKFDKLFLRFKNNRNLKNQFKEQFTIIG